MSSTKLFKFRKLRKKSTAGMIYLFSLIFLVLILLVFMAYFLRYKDVMGKKAYDDACNQYIKLHMIGKNKFIDAPLEDFPCPTKEITINTMGKSGKSLKFKVMEDVSNNMLACYNSFSRGENNLFTGEQGGSVNFCAVCYKMNFTDKNVHISTYELLEFMATTGTSKEKFMDIFTSDELKDRYMENKDEFEDNLSSQLAINTSNDYIIVFKYEKINESTSLSNQIKNLAQAYVDQQVDLVGNVVKGALIGAGVVIVGGVIIVATGGTGLAVIATAGKLLMVGSTLVPATVGGAALGAYFSLKKVNKSPDGFTWASGIELIPFDTDNMGALSCDKMIGIQQPGITSK